MSKNILSESKNISYLPCLVWQTQKLNIPDKLSAHLMIIKGKI